MTWFRVDDDFGDHPKVLAALDKHPASISLWNIAGAWCAKHGTGGHVPKCYPASTPLRAIGAKLAAILVEVRLWHVTPDGWVFHDWEHRQPSAEEERIKREKARERQQEKRRRDRDSSHPPVTRDSGVTDDGTSRVTEPDVTPGSRGLPAGAPARGAQTRPPASPDPTRPDPNPREPHPFGVPPLRAEAPETAPPSAPPPASEVSKSKRGTRLPADWQPSPEDQAYARSLGLDPKAISEAFRDWWHAKAGKDAAKLDWPATWRGWCRRDAERGSSTRMRTTGGGVHGKHGPAQPAPTDGKFTWEVGEVVGDLPEGWR